MTNGRLLTLVFPELPSYRDMLIDRWSKNLADGNTKTKDEYSWKMEYYLNPIKDKRVQIVENNVWYDATIISTIEDVDG